MGGANRSGSGWRPQVGDRVRITKGCPDSLRCGAVGWVVRIVESGGERWYLVDYFANSRSPFRVEDLGGAA